MKIIKIKLPHIPYIPQSLNATLETTNISYTDNDTIILYHTIITPDLHPYHHHKHLFTSPNNIDKPNAECVKIEIQKPMASVNHAEIQLENGTIEIREFKGITYNNITVNIPLNCWVWL